MQYPGNFANVGFALVIEHRGDPGQVVEQFQQGLALVMICASDVPFRSLGTARFTAPMSVSTVLPLPLRLSRGRVVLLTAPVPGHLLSQRPFQHGLGFAWHR